MSDADGLYLIRREATGHMYTVQATSAKGAMRVFAARYGPPSGEVFGVKSRGEGYWEFYSVTSRGIRQLAD